jgi:hypothetical protein
MQRRLFEELKEVEKNVQLIQDSYKNIYALVNKLLKAPDKAFEVDFKGVQYNFIYPTTQTEKNEMRDLRRKLLSEIFKECFNQMVDGQDPWWMVTAFASGIDTLDMQIEIVKEDVVNRVDESGERITALPLDMDNYQIKQEMEYDKPDQTLDL